MSAPIRKKRLNKKPTAYSRSDTPSANTRTKKRNILSIASWITSATVVPIHARITNVNTNDNFYSNSNSSSSSSSSSVTAPIVDLVSNIDKFLELVKTHIKSTKDILEFAMVIRRCQLPLTPDQLLFIDISNKHMLLLLQHFKFP